MSPVVPLNFHMHAQIAYENRLPMDVVSGRDIEFTRDLLIWVFKTLETTLSTSFFYHPQFDGQPKWVNKVIKDMLQAHVVKKPMKWEHCLPILEFSYNDYKHTSNDIAHLCLCMGFSHNPFLVSWCATLRACLCVGGVFLHANIVNQRTQTTIYPLFFELHESGCKLSTSL